MEKSKFWFLGDRPQWKWTIFEFDYFDPKSFSLQLINNNNMMKTMINNFKQQALVNYICLQLDVKVSNALE